jgi:putative transposase
VTLLCKLLQVSRSGFYDFQKHRHSRRDSDPDKAELEVRVKEIFRKSRQTYGSRRIMKQLRHDGHEIGRYQVRSLMRKLGLKAKVPRRYKVTTDSNHNHPIAPNLLDRQFDVDAPNKVWTADITYVWTLEGWIYLAVVMDLFSRQIVGWAMDKQMKTQLVMDALAMAYWRRKPEAGLLHHSDRGSQYASGAYRSQLLQWQMIASMSRKGDCWDNAPTERFFRSLKSEHLVDYRFSTRKMALKEILEYITFYNAYRLHSTLGYESPLEYETRRLLRAA